MTIEEETRALLASAADMSLAEEDGEEEFPEIEIVQPPPAPRRPRPPAPAPRQAAPAPAPPPPAPSPPPPPMFSEGMMAELESSVRAANRSIARVEAALGVMRAAAGWDPRQAPRAPRVEAAPRAPRPPSPADLYDERIPPAAAQIFARTARGVGRPAPAPAPEAAPPDPRLMKPTDLITEEDPISYEGDDQ